MNLENITIGSAIWEKDYTTILGTNYFELLYHSDIQCNRLLVVNNVNNNEKVKSLLTSKDLKKLNMDIIWEEENEEFVLSSFPGKKITKKSFEARTPIHLLLKSFLFKKNKLKKSYNGFWYSIGPLTAIAFCKTKYLLYFTGDAHIKKTEDFNWIHKAISIMEKDNSVISACPVWNNSYDYAKQESVGEIDDFYVNNVFSDQCFLIDVEKVKSTANFFNETNSSIKRIYPIYATFKSFECRVCSYLRNHNMKRLVYKYSSYNHEDFTDEVIKYYQNLH